MLKKSFIAVMFLLSLAGLGLVSCHVNSSYINRENDKNDGEKIVAQLYDLLKNKDYVSTYSIFDKRFFQVTDTQKLHEMYEVAYEKLGTIEGYTIENWKTEAIVGTDSRTNYQFLCNLKKTIFTS